MNREVSKNLHAALWNVVHQARHLQRIIDGDLKVWRDISRETAEGNLWAALGSLDAVLREEESELEA